MEKNELVKEIRAGVKSKPDMHLIQVLALETVAAVALGRTSDFQRRGTV